ncbi:hypothetical protein BgiBS90_017389 [Biomphalaria glabrata]|nr:hypothetical protein BgiBS90_017389 [Biomphalaria glabrata]
MNSASRIDEIIGLSQTRHAASCQFKFTGTRHTRTRSRATTHIWPSSGNYFYARREKNSSKLIPLTSLWEILLTPKRVDGNSPSSAGSHRHKYTLTGLTADDVVARTQWYFVNTEPGHG